MPGLVFIGIAMIAIGVLIPVAIALRFDWPHILLLERGTDLEIGLSERGNRLGIFLSAVPIAGLVELVLGIGILLRRGWSYRGAVIWKWILGAAAMGCFPGGIVIIAVLDFEPGLVIAFPLWAVGIIVAAISVSLLFLLQQPSVAEAMCRGGSPRQRGVPQVPEGGGRTTTVS
jgi:hypothetical protein